MTLSTECNETNEGFNTITFKVTGSAFGESSSAKDVPCLVDPPKHNWYEIGIYWKCSKCGMSYETTPEKGLRL